MRDIHLTVSQETSSSKELSSPKRLSSSEQPSQPKHLRSSKQMSTAKQLRSSKQPRSSNERSSLKQPSSSELLRSSKQPSSTELKSSKELSSSASVDSPTIGRKFRAALLCCCCCCRRCIPRPVLLLIFLRRRPIPKPAVSVATTASNDDTDGGNDAGDVVEDCETGTNETRDTNDVTEDSEKPPTADEKLNASADTTSPSAAGGCNDANGAPEDDSKEPTRANEKPDGMAQVWGDATPLALLFRAPRDVTFNGIFEDALSVARESGRLLLVNLQSAACFGSHAINRDIWSNEYVKDVISARFVFWQSSPDMREGSLFAEHFQVTVFPHVAVMHPTTRRVLWGREGWTPANPWSSREMVVALTDLVFDQLGQPNSDATVVDDDEPKFVVEPPNIGMEYETQQSILDANPDIEPDQLIDLQSFCCNRTSYLFV